MIVSEQMDNGKRILHYSSDGVYIRQVETGREYESAVDVVPCAYTYEETDTPIETELSAEEALAELREELE